MKRKIATVLLMLLIAAVSAVGLAACGNKDAEETASDTTQSDEELAADKDDSANAEAQTDEEDTANIEKTIGPDLEEELGNDLPLQIESVILYKDGSIRIIPTDDLKKNELGESEADSIMPFAESGEAKDIYLMKIGNAGYRTIVALMDDGTISAVNTRALIEDHIVAVMDNVGGRDSFTGVEQDEGEDGFSVIGKTTEGDDVLLDPVLLTESSDEEPQTVSE